MQTDEVLLLPTHGGGFGCDPGNIRAVDANICPFPVRHCRKFAPSPVINRSFLALVCKIGAEPFDGHEESFQGIDGESVLKCHFICLSFGVEDFDPPRVVNGWIWPVKTSQLDRLLSFQSGLEREADLTREVRQNEPP